MKFLLLPFAVFVFFACEQQEQPKKTVVSEPEKLAVEKPAPIVESEKSIVAEPEKPTVIKSEKPPEISSSSSVKTVAIDTAALKKRLDTVRKELLRDNEEVTENKSSKKKFFDKMEEDLK